LPGPFAESYVWKYRQPEYTKDPAKDCAEDISHGSIDVGFAYLCYKHKISFNSIVVFQHSDMEKFAGTFLNFLYSNPPNILDYMTLPPGKGPV